MSTETIYPRTDIAKAPPGNVCPLASQNAYINGQRPCVDNRASKHPVAICPSKRPVIRVTRYTLPMNKRPGLSEIS